MSGFMLEVLNFFDSLCDTCLVCIPFRRRRRRSDPSPRLSPRFTPSRPRPARSRSPIRTVYGSYVPLVSDRHPAATSPDLLRDTATASVRRYPDEFTYRPSSCRNSWSSRSRSRSSSPSLHETSVIFKGGAMSGKNLTIDALLAMTPIVNDIDIVTSAARHLLLSHVKSQPSVHEVFFSSHKKGDAYESQIDPAWFEFNRFACLYVSQAICKCKDPYGIHTLLLEEKIDGRLNEVYRSPHWKKLGFALYTMLFKDIVKDESTKVPFKAFLESDRQEWARKVSERVREKQWVYTHLISPVVTGKCTDEDYNRNLNILFVKLHLLDPTTVMPIYDYFRKALPDLNLELVTTNYLGAPLDWALIRPDVEAALRQPTFPTNASKLTVQELEVYYGLRVLEFIMQDAKEMGLWTGKYPDNKRISQLRDRCSIM